MTALPHGARALPMGRVLTALELSLTLVVDPAGDGDSGADLVLLLSHLGVPDELPGGGPSLAKIATELVELVEEHDRLSTEGPAAIPEDLPAGVDRLRWLDAELERLTGELEGLVRLVAATLR